LQKTVEKLTAENERNLTYPKDHVKENPRLTRRFVRLVATFCVRCARHCARPRWLTEKYRREAKKRPEKTAGARFNEPDAGWFDFNPKASQVFAT
jgi:hypothetical protein